MNLPDTRASMILRLADSTDVEAWDQFVTVYEPLVYRLARQRGLQHADAEELVQEVMLAVARSVDRWEPDPNKGRFRDWLFRIARNLIINRLTRRQHRALGTGKSDVADLLANQVDDRTATSTLFDMEYRREVFRWAAERVKAEVRPNTWEAFFRSTVSGIPPARVADQLQMTVGSVYIARSRVIARLQRHARDFDTRQQDPTQARTGDNHGPSTD